MAPLGFLGFGQYLSEAPCHASQLCMCVCVHANRLAVVGVIAEYKDRETRDLFTPLRSRDDHQVHDCTLRQSTCHVDFMGSLGHEMVAFRPQDL